MNEVSAGEDTCHVLVAHGFARGHGWLRLPVSGGEHAGC